MNRYAPHRWWVVQPLGVWYLSLSAAEQHARNLVSEGHYPEASVTDGTDGPAAYVVSLDGHGSLTHNHYI